MSQNLQVDPQKLWDSLAKPKGSLGELETVASRLARIQQRNVPRISHPRFVVFAADHGVAWQEPVSAYPSHITARIFQLIAHGKAAINILAAYHQASLLAIDCGIRWQGLSRPQSKSHEVTLWDRHLGEGSGNMLDGPCLSQTQVQQALKIGSDAVASLSLEGCDILVLGEVGIGNTTSASAMSAAILGMPADTMVGPGTGLNFEGLKYKAQVVKQVLSSLSAPADIESIQRHCGGLEISAMAGAMISAHKKRMPILLDGFVASTAALIAQVYQPNLGQSLISTTLSAEPGHKFILDRLNCGKPLLNLGLRLGEGSAAGLALPLLRMASELVENMARLDDVVA